MRVRHGGRMAVVLGGLGLAALACTEDVTSPAQCPDFCPTGQIETVDSLLGSAIERDSSFRGYIGPHEAAVMLAASLPQVDSRPIFETLPTLTRYRIGTGNDTTTGPLVVDSIRLQLTLQQVDSAARNLRLAFYRMPLGLDSTSSFSELAPAFTSPPARIVNIDSLLRHPGQLDSLTGDSVISIDTLRRAAVVSLKFDTTQIPFVPTDSGRVALGVRVTADAFASVALGTNQAGAGPVIMWYNRVDSAGVLLNRPMQTRGAAFDGFVFDPPAPPLDSLLTIGGMPASRALLRIALPRGIRDSTQIIRATLLLVAAAPLTGVPSDSAFVAVRRIAADLGAKSPVSADAFVPKSPLLGPGAPDTVRIEVTSLLRSWQADTAAVTAAYLQLLALDRRDSTVLTGTEGATFMTLRVYSSRTAALRPSLRVTYVPRFKFGVP